MSFSVFSDLCEDRTPALFGARGTGDAIAARKPAGTITLSDVAREAGVSIATASKALNGRDQVRAETRQRVLDAAAALSFTPNPFAQALNSRRTGTIGMLTNDLDNRFVLPVLLGAEDAFGAGSTSVFLCDARGDSVREQHHIKNLLAKRVDGIVVLGRTTNPRPSITATIPVPVVYAYAPSEDERDSSFTPDNALAGVLAARHLIERGRRRIALINGEPSYSAAHDRARGVEQALTEAGLPLVGGDVLYGQWSESWGRQCAETLLDAHPDLDALICASDQIARGALDHLRETGRSVPRDVAVVGFDNWDLLVEAARPPLTSIDMQLETLGRAAAEELSHAIHGRATAGVRSMPVRLVPRESSG
ncbi:substrate-binding domain-containing protein [Rathayibacter sp. VKM Ac-2803]|uniref:LacI family DNA-binding transcriptional regulator n=1 Tax=unclassified Rathayibacter TaxID=2609250 RepID=UPI001356CF2D|nr:MULTISPECIES: LacI family DNA-binding transcriptional regulator [unclassified Rathayibacter]MWV48143.1 substrate-binding domain-containing protein [Rathayibacter sp. VKM Ac-2803]MWV59364.1 substrate-binding domain-containing protein [Rathayibacter sp. VKM Ac-2754]